MAGGFRVAAVGNGERWAAVDSVVCDGSTICAALGNGDELPGVLVKSNGDFESGIRNDRVDVNSDRAEVKSVRSDSASDSGSV